MKIQPKWLALMVMLCSTGWAGAWELDYGKALQQSRKDGKPVLVVIGRGADGWRGLLIQPWSENLLKMVHQQFHAVYVDAEDVEYGKALAQLFQSSQLPALIISDRYGRSQAVRREGQLTAEQLEQLLHLHNGGSTGSQRSVAVQQAPEASRPVTPARTPALLCPT
jgi:hypothetical protein